MTMLEIGLAASIDRLGEVLRLADGGQGSAGAAAAQYSREALAPGEVRVTDNPPDRIPVSAKELAAIEMFLSGIWATKAPWNGPFSAVPAQMAEPRPGFAVWVAVGGAGGTRKPPNSRLF